MMYDGMPLILWATKDLNITKFVLPCWYVRSENYRFFTYFV
jgi:hypothetical protein